MIIEFKDTATEDIFNGKSSKKAQKACPKELWELAQRKLDQLDSAISLQDLKVPLGNKLKKLTGDRLGQHSVRINNQYRICFIWSDQGPSRVEIIDYHS